MLDAKDCVFVSSARGRSHLLPCPPTGLKAMSPDATCVSRWLVLLFPLAWSRAQSDMLPTSCLWGRPLSLHLGCCSLGSRGPWGVEGTEVPCAAHLAWNQGCPTAGEQRPCPALPLPTQRGHWGKPGLHGATMNCFLLSSH